MTHGESERRKLCDQVLSLLAANDIRVDDEIMALMEPLLDGRLSYAEHRAMLERMLGTQSHV